MSEIEWRPLPSCPAYFISSHGQARYRDKRSLRKLHDTGKYLMLGFRCNGKFVNRPIHSLVAEAFIGPRPEGMEIRHLDGDRLNNRRENLAYGTKLENAADREGHNRTARGNRSGTSKVSDSDVDFIRMLYFLKCANQYELAALFRISQAQINNIVLRKQRQRAA